MKNLVKVSLIVAAFAFAAGCSTHEGPNDVVHQDSVSNAAHNVHHHSHHAQKCHKHHCGKLGVEKRSDDTAK